MSARRPVVAPDPSGLQLDSISTPSDARRADARAYLERTGNADLVEILGLGDAPAGPRFSKNGRRLCPACDKPLPLDDRARCRRVGCSMGPAARGVTR